MNEGADPGYMHHLIHHEAGHAVASYISRLGFSKVTIESGLNDPWGGFLLPTERSPEGKPKAVAKEIVAPMAGIAAEEQTFGNYQDGLGYSDRERAHSLADSVTGGNSVASAALVEKLWRQSREMMAVPRHLRAVQALAEALITRKTIRRTAARSIIAAALAAAEGPIA